MPFRLAAVLASAAVYGALFAPSDWVALSWVCVVPLYLALQGTARGTAVALAGLWGFAATLVIIAWLVPTLTDHFDWSIAPSVALWGAFSLAAMAPFTAVTLGLSARPARPLARAALFAAAWVAAEYARTHVGLASPWTKLGDAHADSPHLRQIADLGGVYLVSGVVAFANGAIAETCAGVAARRRAPMAPLAAAAGVVALSMLYGAVQSGAPRASGFEVAIVQGNVASELRWSRAAAGRVLHRYGSLTRDLLVDASGPPPALIVWPENAIQTQLDDAVYGPPLRRLADRVPLLIGAPRSEERGGVRHHFNSALLLWPGGRVEIYDKRRLLPFSETQPFGFASLGARGDLDTGAYTAGEHTGVFDVDGRRLAVLICMEALYPELAREAVRDGASLLVIPSNDGWYAGRGGAAQHLAQVRFRAVETRLPIVRATTTGISAVIAPDGTLLGRVEEGVSGVLRVDVPWAGEAPFYARFGDWFAFGCIGIWSGLTLVSLLRWSSTSESW